MGGFSSDNSSMSMVSAIGSVMGSALGQARQTKADQEAQQQSYDQQAAALRSQRAAEIADRQDLLRRTLAAQRARLGAMGVGSSGGSADALIAGLTQKAATDMSNIETRYGDSLAALQVKRQKQARSAGTSLLSGSSLTGGQGGSPFGSEASFILDY